MFESDPSLDSLFDLGLAAFRHGYRHCRVCQGGRRYQDIGEWVKWPGSVRKAHVAMTKGLNVTRCVVMICKESLQ